MKKPLIFQANWHWPKRIEELMKSKVRGFSLHVCSGASELGDIKVDIEPQNKDTIKADARHLPFKPNTFDTVLCDPPWHLPYHLRWKLLYEIRDVCKWNGNIIFNSLWLPGIKHTELIEVIVSRNGFPNNCSLIGTYHKFQHQLETFLN